MEINLTHEDFVAMAKQYVANMGINTEGKEIDISASVGRKEKRITASVSILDATPSVSIPETAEAPVEAVKSPVRPVKDMLDELVEEEEVEETPTSLFK